MPNKKTTSYPASTPRRGRVASDRENYNDPNYASRLRTKDADNCYGAGRRDVERPSRR